MNNFFLQQIELDLRSFTDPGSPILVDNELAIWKQGGIDRQARFVASPNGGYPDVVFQDIQYGYTQFLASEHMAALVPLAHNILSIYHTPGNYIDTAASLLDDIDEASTSNGSSALSLINDRASTNLPYQSTRVILLHGEAGSGKTISLRELMNRQCKRFIAGESDFLYVYFDAQGKSLSNIDDVMARQTQDLRARFTYSAVSALTRRRLIVPIIDGFDELLGAGGYDDAFASLAAFIAKLNGLGVIIASARSSFFDYKNFYENASRVSNESSLNYSLDIVQLHPWSEENVRDFVAQKLGGPETEKSKDFFDLYGQMNEKNRALLTKPFYASKSIELLGEMIRLW